MRNGLSNLLRRSLSLVRKIVRTLTPHDDPVKQRWLELFFLGLFWMALGFSAYALYYAYTHDWPAVTSFWFWQKYSETIRNMLLAAAGFVGAVFGLFQLHNSAKRTRTGAIQAKVGLEGERNERFV